MKKFRFDIDVVSACNLSCPSCPQGNFKHSRQPQGQMTPALLRRLVAKASSECSVERISLFSWCEPLLHPEIHELIRIVQEKNISCYMSSNLNILPDANAIMAANPYYFKISVSGFTQKTYSYSHRGGDVELVKRHLRELATAKLRNNATTRIVVNYHRYRHNLKEEQMMRSFADDLGFEFEPVWALLFPLEKIIGYLDDDTANVPFTPEDIQLSDRLALPFQEALAPPSDRRKQSCDLQREQISLDFRGNVQLCCGVFDVENFTLGNYLDRSLSQFQDARRNHPMCIRCLHYGADRYITYSSPGMENLLLEKISPEDTELLDLRHEFARKRLKRFLQNIYKNFFFWAFTTEQKVELMTKLKRILTSTANTKRSPRQ